MRRVLVMCAVLAVVAGAAAVSAGAGAGGPGLAHYDVVLDNAFGLTAGSDLKADGVRIGKVDSLDVQRSTGRAIVGIKLSRSDFGDLRSDVFCRVEPQSLIGEYFLNCDAGKSPRRLPDGATIPVTQTAATIPPDLVLGVMRKPARERFGVILDELGAGLAGRGPDLNATIRRALPALSETDRVLKLLADNRATLRTLTRNSDAVLARLAANRGDVARFVSKARDTAVASAERRGALAATIHKLPAFLRALRPTLADLGTVAREQTPALADLRAGAGDLQTLFTRLGPFAEAARPAIRSLGDASVVGLQAARAARPTVAKLRGAAAKAPEPLTNLRFVLEHLNDRTFAVEPNRLSPGGKGFTGLEALLQYFFVQSQAINIFDTRGHILKLDVLINECSQYTNAKTARDNPARTKRCSEALGPNQPGITDVTTRTRPAARRLRSTQHAPGRRGSAAPPAVKTTPAPASPPAAPPAADQAKGLLQRLLDGLPLPKIPSPGPRSGDRGLLDFLLGP